MDLNLGFAINCVLLGMSHYLFESNFISQRTVVMINKTAYMEKALDFTNQWTEITHLSLPF